MSWTRIAPTESVPMREGRAVRLGRREIAVFRVEDGFLAIDNMCPHNQGPLADGIVKGTTVVCPLHGWNVCLESGKVCKPDVPVSVRTYPARVSDGIIEIDLSAEQQAEVA